MTGEKKKKHPTKKSRLAFPTRVTEEKKNKK